ncbi:MAG: hypothetical protein RLZZ303_1582 [Candidatus Hydrogenedentota bacterium]|jgi:hypothetical protein
MRRIVSILILVSSASAFATTYARPDEDSLKVLHVSDAIALMHTYLEEHPDSADAWLHLGSIHANAYARGMDAVEIVHEPAGDELPAPQGMGIPPKTAARRLDSVSEPRLTHLAQAVRAFQRATKHTDTSSKEKALVGLGYALYECHDRFEKVPWPLEGEPFDAEAKQHGAEPQWWKDQALGVLRQIEIPAYSNEEEMWRNQEPGNTKSAAALYIVTILQDRASRTEEEDKELTRLKISADPYLASMWMYLPFKPVLPPQPREIEAIYPVTPAGLDTANLYLRAFDATMGDYVLDIDLPYKIVAPPIVVVNEENNQVKASASDMLQKIDNFLDHHSESIRLMNEAARGKECRYPIDMSEGIGVNLAHLSLLRQLARVLALQSLYAAHKENSGLVTLSLTSLAALADSLRSEPTTISQLLRIALIGILVEALQDAQNRMALGSNDLRILQERLARLEGLDGLVATLKGESYCYQLEAAKPVEEEPVPEYPSMSAEERAEMIQRMKDYIAMRPKPNDVRQAYEAMLVSVTLPFPEAHAELKRARTTDGLMAPALPRVLVAFYRCQAQLRTAQIALAVDRYSRTNSGSPESLNDLVPVYIRELPLDPFTDEPMRYELLDGGFMVYSVGDNLVDDNGVKRIEAGPNQEPVRMADVVYQVGGLRDAKEGEGTEAD